MYKTVFNTIGNTKIYKKSLWTYIVTLEFDSEGIDIRKSSESFKTTKKLI